MDDLFIVNPNVHCHPFSMNKRVKGIFLRDFVNNHSNSTFKNHNHLGLRSFVELIIDNCSYTFDPCFEVLDKKNLNKLISPLIKEEMVFFTKDFIKNYLNSTLKDQHFLILSIFGELIIYHC